MIIGKQIRILLSVVWIVSENIYHVKNCFCIFTGIALPPKGIINIPVMFVPKIMRLQKTMVIIQMMRANGKSWPIDNFDELSTDTKR